MNDLVRTEALQDCHWEYVCRTQGDCINTLVRTVSNDYLERKEGRKEGSKEKGWERTLVGIAIRINRKVIFRFKELPKSF